MKKIIFLLLILAGYSGFSQISVRTQTTPTQLTAGNGTVVVRSGSVSVTTSTVSLLPTLLTNTTTAMKRGIDTLNQSERALLSYAKDGSGNTLITRLNDVYTSVYNSNTNLGLLYTIGTQLHEAYIIRKLDSLDNKLTAISERTLSGLGVSSQITYTTAFVTKGSAGNLYGCYGYNSKTSGQYILFFNSTSIPADATAPYVASIYVPALSSFSFNFGSFGVPFSTGIVWSNSSTPQTKTIGSSDVQLTVIYK